MSLKIEIYTKLKGSKKWLLKHRVYHSVYIPISYHLVLAKKEGAYYTKCTSDKLVYFKHFKHYDLKGVYTYVS